MQFLEILSLRKGKIVFVLKLRILRKEFLQSFMYSGLFFAQRIIDELGDFGDWGGPAFGQPLLPYTISHERSNASSVLPQSAFNLSSTAV